MPAFSRVARRVRRAALSESLLWTICKFHPSIHCFLSLGQIFSLVLFVKYQTTDGENASLIRKNRFSKMLLREWSFDFSRVMTKREPFSASLPFIIHSRFPLSFPDNRPFHGHTIALVINLPLPLPFPSLHSVSFLLDLPPSLPYLHSIYRSSPFCPISYLSPSLFSLPFPFSLLLWPL